MKHTVPSPSTDLRQILRLVTVILAGWLTVTPAFSAQDPTGVRSIEILPGWRMSDGTHMAALSVELEPGWKTYWRAPGDAGIPPHFDWTGSKNVKNVRMFWPRPEVVTVAGMRSIVYHDEVVIPLQLAPKSPDAPIEMQVELNLGVCKDICIPVNLNFDIALPASQTTPDAVIRAALASQPESAKQAGVRSVSCAVAPIRDGMHVTAMIDMPPTGGDEVAVLEGPDPSIWVSDAQTSRKGSILTASADMVPASNAPFALDSTKIRITILGQDRAVDIQGCTTG